MLRNLLISAWDWDDREVSGVSQLKMAEELNGVLAKRLHASLRLSPTSWIQIADEINYIQPLSQDDARPTYPVSVFAELYRQELTALTDLRTVEITALFCPTAAVTMEESLGVYERRHSWLVDVPTTGFDTPTSRLDWEDEHSPVEPHENPNRSK